MENGIFTIFARKKPICYDVFSFYGRVSIVLSLGKVSVNCICGTRFSETRTIQSPHWLLCSVRSFVKIASFMKSTFSVNIVNSVYSVYSFQFIYLVYIYLLFGALMGFEAKCICSKHVARGTWKRFASMHYKYFRFDIDPKCVPNFPDLQDQIEVTNHPAMKSDNSNIVYIPGNNSETRTIQSLHWLLCSVRSFVKIASFMKSTFSVNIVNSVYSVYSFQFICLVYVYLLFGALMGFEAKCVCSKHSTWHHGDISAASLRIASPEELEFCGVDTSKNKTRKRKICLPCRERIALELKCRRYEVCLCLQASNLLTDSLCVIFLLHYCASHNFLLL